MNTAHGKYKVCSYNIFKDRVSILSENRTQQLLPLEEVEFTAKDPLEQAPREEVEHPVRSEDVEFQDEMPFELDEPSSTQDLESL